MMTHTLLIVANFLEAFKWIIDSCSEGLGILTQNPCTVSFGLLKITQGWVGVDESRERFFVILVLWNFEKSSFMYGPEWQLIMMQIPITIFCFQISNFRSVTKITKVKHNYFILHLKFFKKNNTKLIQKKYHSISRFLIQKVTYDAVAFAFQIVICKVDLLVSYVTYLSSNLTRHLHYY